ncbi:hypothetical protein PGT21_033556 [Puccinia graminis f. sp. tritici]|uniref:Nuclear condensin complex subunit 3 C-terminal domain-containing protein n=2 Tax=Puccinia graminis f. sp. tritici TaxID=56615 RepID=E3JQ75_PUCGT|nr:uncharacterized protein PGTG_00321 [Puccinia graminis f. sp. tritici CRL 75-36-700-3]EFP74365.2 hypothetical protein PGTG_00321 [Puccinia graminis f. sp. tritici CRL 75-36-700-3]KAA1115215.1 hypothetical protein PGT21_033556 [Puccinia graminis f. sp. tritici]
MARQTAGTKTKKNPKQTTSAASKKTGKENEQETEKIEETQNGKPSKHENTLTSLTNSILTLFNKSQHSLTSHRKLVNNLHSLFLSSTEIREQIENGDGTDKTIKLIGEKNFTEACYTVLDNIVSTKKGVVEADRVVRFFGAFCAFATEHDPHKESEDQTATNRFLLHSIKYLSRGFEAKNRFVRFRCCQLIAYVVNSLEEIDDDLFSDLKHKLLIRIHDKEKDVRQQAAIALMNFRPVNEEDEEEDSEENVNDALIDLMMRDPSSEVRRTVLHKLCETPSTTTLPAILTRLRDIDPLIRRMVYRDLYLATLAKPEPTLPPDPSQCFSLDQRYTILKGLKDREESVRKETANLANCWIKVGFKENIEAFLATMDLISLGFGEEDEDEKNKIENIENVVKTWLTSHGLDPTLELDEVENDQPDEFGSDSWWTNINPERAFLLRVAAEHYKSFSDETKLDEVMPVVTALAFRMEHNFQALTELLQTVEQLSPSQMEDEETAEKVQLAAQKTFVLRELLTVAMLADYGDEIGRRKMFSLLRDLVSDPLLPHSLIPGCLEVLSKLSTGERDFMRVIVELVQELRCNLDTDPNFTTSKNVDGAPDGQEDDDDDDSEPDEGAGEASFRKGKDGKLQVTTFTLNPANADLDSRCLEIVRSLLERVSGSIKDNTSMFGIVHELIVPAVRCKDTPIRERGLVCLGLCSLLDKQIALDSFGVFVHQVQAAEIDLRIKVLKIVFDLLLQHGIDFLAEKGHGPERVIEFLLYSLDQDSKDVQATAVIGISKLMLSGIITSSEVLQMLVLVYFSPETCDNQKLRQCLSYFLPVYCYCSSVNQRRMQSMMLPALDVLSGVYDDQEDKSEMLSPSQIALQLVDWTDPSKVVVLPGCKVDWDLHLDAAIDILKNLYRVTEKDERKMLCQMLPKLTLPDTLDNVHKLRGLSLLISQLDEKRPLTDSLSRNVLNKFHTSLEKRFAEKLSEGAEKGDQSDKETEEEEEEELKEFKDFIDEFNGDQDGNGSSEADDLNSDPDAANDDYSAKVVVKKTPTKKSIKSVARISMASLRNEEVTDSENEGPAPRRSGRPRASRQPDPKVAAVNEELASLIGSSTDEDGSSQDESTEKED